MKALVTGGGGFLGRYIVEQLLARGETVTVFARGAYPELETLGARVVRGDLQDAGAVRRACAGMDVVFHVAAKAGMWGAWDDFYGTNVIGTQNVIAACRANGVPKLINTSSPSVIFDGTPQEGVDESYPYPAHYESPYPHTKAIAEQAVIAAHQGDTQGVPLLTVSLRPHLIIGPRDNHLLPGLLASARTGLLPQVGDGTNKVDLTDVEDAARAHLLAADALAPGSPLDGPPGHGRVYFISQDEPVVLWPWIRALLRELGLPEPRVRISLSVARAAGGLLETLHTVLRRPGEPRLTRFIASELAQSHYYDISAAQRDFGYAPQRTMAEVMARVAAWVKEVDGQGKG
ncbi:MAG TPA: NAD-dependent epimerase/dehydratase family protein [Anaerolineae bacterium]|nr:NAD-dependent epimerase/dehydratase family protein [Anaerolineae bacterium]HQH36994.1 NAD-dependent epimerase/dehydratase family protein [Anaerolineae bacterium]